MKLATHLITLSLLLIISTHAAAASGEFYSSSEAVVDIDGDEVKMGEEYYMFATAGSFTLGSTGCNPCPLDVVLEPSDVYLGIPLTFLPINNNHPGNIVRVSTDLNIKFNTTSVKSTRADAAESTLWNLEQDRCTDRSIVTTGGRGVEGLFKFEREILFLYKILSCPNSSESFAPCGEMTFPVHDVDSPRRRLFISSAATSTTERVIYVGIAKANYTVDPIKLMKNINGILKLATH